MDTERKTKQVIVMRRDLNMRKGKIAAQAGHASLGAVLSGSYEADYAGESGRMIPLDKALNAWLTSSFRKICVYVNSETELLEIYQKAVDGGLRTVLITDNGDTEFNGVPTKTCCAIGPAFEDEVDPITGKLPLY